MTHILILEDDKTFAGLVAQSLRSEGYEVALAHSGAEALALAEQQAFDLAIVDMYIRIEGHLTPDGGVLFISRLRSQLPQHVLRTARKVPVLAISGAVQDMGTFDVLHMASKLGADDILAKPFAPQVLIERIEALLRRAPAA